MCSQELSFDIVLSDDLDPPSRVHECSRFEYAEVPNALPLNDSHHAQEAL